MACTYYTEKEGEPCDLWDVVRFCRQGSMSKEEIEKAGLELPFCYTNYRG
ncbi:unnamed protein product [marine sediment metagenome]|uniref:Uncharacterized protein n=1 Tax=marine sediment metagenome TaxID=412755 RepID=X1GRZ9_9ZZZZ